MHNDAIIVRALKTSMKRTRNHPLGDAPMRIAMSASLSYSSHWYQDSSMQSC